jgi:hypothetical protein
MKREMFFTVSGIVGVSAASAYYLLAMNKPAQAQSA